MVSKFSVAAMVRGYHIYEDIWDATVGEELPCQREPDNRQDPFAVAVVRLQVTVGHIPRRISSICSMFLRPSGSVRCSSRKIAGNSWPHPKENIFHLLHVSKMRWMHSLSSTLPLHKHSLNSQKVYTYRWFSWGVASLPEGKSRCLGLVQLRAKYRLVSATSSPYH